MNLPHDWLNPDFARRDMCNDWKNYVGDDLAEIWVTFFIPQKRAIASSLQDIADGEDWD